MQKMKKFLFSLFFTLCFTFLRVNAASIPNLYYDFETDKIPIQSVVNNNEGAYIYISEDPENAENHTAKYYGDGATDTETGTKFDRYTQIGSQNFSGKVIISFRVYFQDGNGSFRAYLRDMNGTTNNINLFSISASKISFFGNNTISGDFSGRWIEYKLISDAKNDYCAAYCNASGNSLEKIYEGKLSDQGEAKFKAHTFYNTTFRFGLMTSKATIYLDDLELFGDISLNTNLLAGGIKLTKNIVGYSDELVSLKAGDLSFTADISGVSDNISPENATVYAALFSKEGIMKQLSCSQTARISSTDITSLTSKLNISFLTKGDYVKMFILSDGETITPLAASYTFEQSELYYRPTVHEILSDFSAHNPSAEHPRVIASKSDFDRMRTYSETDELFKTWMSNTKSSADSYLNCALPEYIYDERNTILAKSRYVMNRVFPMAMMYQLTGDTKYADGVWRLMEVVCDESKFPDWNHKNHYLDTGEMGLAAAVAYDWCYDYWTDDQKAFIERAVYDNIIIPSSSYFKGTSGFGSGLTAGTNWNPVCNGGSIAAAAAVFDVYPDDCSYLVSKSVYAIEKCLHDYAIDGGYSESPTYWTYGTTYLVWALSTLDSAFGSSYGIENADGLSKTGYFPYNATGPTGNWNYHDGGTGQLDTSLSMFFAKKYNDANLAGLRLNLMENKWYSKKINGGFKDMLFYSPDLINSDFDITDLSFDSCYRHINTAFFRGSFTDASTVFTGLHGGDNSVNHGDMDAGTFILDMAGQRFIGELGGDNYTLPGYFSGSKWQYYRKGAEGQNTIVIADDPTIKYGQNPSANIQITDFETGTDGGFAVCDMTPTLGSKVISGKRGIKLFNNRSEVVLQDEITFSESTKLYWIAHSQSSDITLSEDARSAVITKGRKRLGVTLISDNENLKFSVYDATTPLLEATNADMTGQASRASFQRLCIEAENITEFNVSVVFKLIDDSSSDTADITYIKTSMDNWNV